MTESRQSKTPGGTVGSSHVGASQVVAASTLLTLPPGSVVKGCCGSCVHCVPSITNLYVTALPYGTGTSARHAPPCFVIATPLDQLAAPPKSPRSSTLDSP